MIFSDDGPDPLLLVGAVGLGLALLAAPDVRAQPTYDTNVARQGAPSGAQATNTLTEAPDFYDPDGGNDVLGDLDDDVRGDGTISPDSPLIDAAAESYTALQPLNGTSKTNAWDVGAAESHNTSLPVTYAGGSVTIKGDEALLQWRVTDETNLAGYEVSERRGDGFASIKQVAAGRDAYHVTDAALGSNARHNGELAWRITSVDTDGTREVLDTLRAAYAPDAGLTASNPNPQRVRVTTRRAGDLQLAIYDVMGRTVAVLHEGPTGSDRTVTARVPDGLASGTYLLRGEGSATTFNEKIQVVR